MENQNKFLVNLLSGLSQKQVFFLIWFAIVGVFISLMMAYYRKTTRRNFRSTNGEAGKKIRVDVRRVSSGGMELAKKKDSSITKLP